ncbi:MAG TPA: hypothetical protein DIV86_02785, partial [Alphaproteobacteria bacterium]|nr:hypothetical protein [Alphaproteobacteria bacterium]
GKMGGNMAERLLNDGHEVVTDNNGRPMEIFYHPYQKKEFSGELGKAGLEPSGIRPNMTTILTNNPKDLLLDKLKAKVDSLLSYVIPNGLVANLSSYYQALCKVSKSNDVAR